MIVAVVIGRNEGERLLRCVQSVPRDVPCVVVDSDSTDGSIDRIAKLVAGVVRLDPSRRMSAARARNAGATEVFRQFKDVQAIMFLDGDTELEPDFIHHAAQLLWSSPQLGAVIGRRQERSPEQTLYNWICDQEWNGPAGDTDAFGGDVLMRADAFRQVGGYNEELIAGEDPEFSHRMRRAGFGIVRLDVLMTKHDANMHHLSQWVQRTQRTGHAYAEVNDIHHDKWAREVRSNWVWGAALPLASVLAVPITLGTSVGLGVLGYGTLWSRIFLAHKKQGMALENAATYAAVSVLAKPVMAWGQWRYHRSKKSGKKSLIEYK